MIDIGMQTPQRFSPRLRRPGSRASLVATAAVRLVFTSANRSARGPGATLDPHSVTGLTRSHPEAPDVPEIITPAGNWSERESRSSPCDRPSRQPAADLHRNGQPRCRRHRRLSLGPVFGDRPGDVLVTLSREFFRGEEEREIGFQGAMRTRYPDRAMIEIDNSDGLTRHAWSRLDCPGHQPQHRCRVLIGGGTWPSSRPLPPGSGRTQSSSHTTLIKTTRGCCAKAGFRPCSITTSGKTCVGLLLDHAGAPSATGAVYPWPSNIHIITPYNMPAPASPHT